MVVGRPVKLMSKHKITFNILIALLSLLLAILLGLVDFFGFLSGDHTLNFIYLTLSLVIWHLLGLTLFLQNLDKQRQESVYLVAAVLFGAVFFIFNHSYLSALLSASAFFLFQIYTERALSKRAKLFVKYSTREIVFPIIRRGFLFLMLILVVVGFFQGQRRAQDKGIISPYMVRVISKPLIPILNKQFSNQIQQQIGPSVLSRLKPPNRQILIRKILGEGLQNLLQNNPHFSFLNLTGIPLDKTLVYDSGEVDLTPVINDSSVFLAQQINRHLSLYLPILPLFFGLLIVLFVSPLIAASEILLLPIIRIFISILLKTKVITVAKTTVETETLILN